MRKLLLLAIVLMGGIATLIFVSRRDAPGSRPPPAQLVPDTLAPTAVSDRTSASLKAAYAEAALVAVGEITRMPESGLVMFHPREVWKGEWLANETGRGDVQLTLPGSMALAGRSALLFKFRTQKVDAQKIVLLEGDHLAGSPELTLNELKNDLAPVPAPASQVASTPTLKGWRNTSRALDAAVEQAGLGPQPSPLPAFTAATTLPPVNLGLVPAQAARRSGDGEVDLTPKTLEQSAQEAVADRLRRMFDGEDVPRAPHRRRPAKS